MLENAGLNSRGHYVAEEGEMNLYKNLCYSPPDAGYGPVPSIQHPASSIFFIVSGCRHATCQTLCILSKAYANYEINITVSIEYAQLSPLNSIRTLRPFVRCIYGIRSLSADYCDEDDTKLNN
jgi:hypothetical protein